MEEALLGSVPVSKASWCRPRACVIFRAATIPLPSGYTSEIKRLIQTHTDEQRWAEGSVVGDTLMKCLCFSVVSAAVLLVLASAGNVFAGVVMVETSFGQSPNGEIPAQDKTIYVQGNKQKVDRGAVAEITDLDKSIIYIIDKHDRVYTEMPLRVLSSSEADDERAEPILKKTGEIRVIANQPCSEYRTVEGNKLERVTISACVSSSAPGAKELSEFARNMGTKLSGREGGRSAKQDSAGLMLEKQSVLSLRVADPSRHNAYRTASFLAATRVKQIQLQPLPPETFKPPEGYSKLPNRPREAAPPDSPKTPDQALRVRQVRFDRWNRRLPSARRALSGLVRVGI
jgi:hypothetical protein